MLEKLKYLIAIGCDPSDSKIEIARVKLLNTLGILVLVVCILLTIVCLFLGLFIQPIVAASCGLLIAVTFIFTRSRRHVIARAYFVGVVSACVIFMSISAYRQGLYTDTENILYANMAFCMLLFKGKSRHVPFWMLFLVVVGLKTIKHGYIHDSYQLPYILTMVNAVTTAVLLYIFLYYFYRALNKSAIEVQASEKRLYSMIDNIPLFIALIDMEGKFVVVNKQYERGFKIRRDQIIGKRPHEIMPAYLADGQAKVVRDAISSGKRIEFKESREMPDGSLNVGHGYVTPVRNDLGEVVNIAGYVNNISELEETKRRLESANASKDKLFAIISHDLKSPINLFESMLAAAKEEVISKENFEQLLEQLREKLQPLKSTMDDLLHWSKSNINDLSAKKQQFDPLKVIEDVMALNTMLAKQKQITVTVSGTSQKVVMDPGHLTVAVRNIIQNALKFTPVKGEINIKIEKSDDYCLVRIEDNGKGMSEEKRKDLLKGLTVTPGMGTGGESGTGIGLSMVSELLKKNNCELAIESEEEKGSAFIIKIPA